VVEHANNTVRKIAPVGTNWVVTTLAGCPTCPLGTNDGPGIAARFNGPFGLTFSKGNVYVTDTGNKTIRKLTPSASGWDVSTFAGKPLVGGYLDGAGTAARFSAPLGLASDAQGNVYVGDSVGVRRIAPDGTMTTLAGHPAIGSADGPGSTATFWSARGVAVDGAGNVYVADQANQLVRRLAFDGAAWNVTTVGGKAGFAGTNAGSRIDARFNQPTGVAVDASGNLYVVDSGAARVSKGSSPDAPASVKFDTSPGALAVSDNTFSIKFVAPAKGSVVVESSGDLSAWLPVRTVPLSGANPGISLPLDPNGRAYYRLRLAP
jgi:hypothetical protein